MFANRLASVALSDQLVELSQQVSHGFKELKLLEMLATRDVPFQRATWFIRVQQLSVAASTTARHSPAHSWTKTLCAALRECLRAPADSTASARHTQRTVARYLSQLVSWQCTEGLLHVPDLLKWFAAELTRVTSTQPRRLALLAFLLQPTLAALLRHPPLTAPLSSPAPLHALLDALAARALTLPPLVPVWRQTALLLSSLNSPINDKCKEFFFQFFFPSLFVFLF